MNRVTTLTEACLYIGKKIPLWTQGAGGNVSKKTGDLLHIKASGFRLDDASTEGAISTVNLAILQRRLANCKTEADYSESLKESTVPGKSRPSMETGFHALLPRRWVCHMHSLVALLMAHERDHAPGRFAKWQESKSLTKIAFVPPVMPGLELARWLARDSGPAIFILQNHGVVLQSDDLDILDEWQSVESEFCDVWGYGESLKPVSFKQIPNCPLKIYFPDSAVFLDRMESLMGEDGALRSNCEEKDQDATELWAATSLLYHAQPALAELPEAIASKVSGLPTEQFRRTRLG